MGDEAAARVVVVDDHGVLAQALAMALRMRGVEVAAVISGPEIEDDEVYRAAEEAAPAIVLLDLHLGDGRESVPLIAPLRRLGSPVLVLTAERDRHVLGRCLEAGADGVFDKAQSFDALVDLLVDAATGRSVMSANAREQLLLDLRTHRTAERQRLRPFEQLSVREVDVLRRLAAGRSAEEIARDECIALSTVRTHIKSVLRKLEVNSQLAAVALAHDAGWVTPSD